MGYTTDFSGSFGISPALKPEHQEYINKFSATRRMERDASKVAALLDPVREKAGLPVGNHGEFFVGGGEFRGQEHDKSVVDFNRPPPSQPGLWCQWVADAPDELSWDGGEKFYHYVEWLEYVVEKFLKPWGYTLNGTVEWFGEDHDDRGRIIVKDNVVTTKVAKITYE